MKQNMEREFALMATAWYSLNSRLQMNNVIVQRQRSESPRSWLNKQRRLLGQASMGATVGPSSNWNQQHQQQRASSISATG